MNKNMNMNKSKNRPFKKSQDSTRARVKPKTGRAMRSTSVHGIGTIVRKQFPNDGYHEGEVVDYDKVKKLYKIKYLIGLTEDYDEQEMKKYYKWDQMYSNENYNNNALEARRQSAILRIPSPEQSRHKESVNNLQKKSLNKVGAFSDQVEEIVQVDDSSSAPPNQFGDALIVLEEISDVSDLEESDVLVEDSSKEFIIVERSKVSELEESISIEKRRNAELEAALDIEKQKIVELEALLSDLEDEESDVLVEDSSKESIIVERSKVSELEESISIEKRRNAELEAFLDIAKQKIVKLEDGNQALKDFCKHQGCFYHIKANETNLYKDLACNALNFQRFGTLVPNEVLSLSMLQDGLNEISNDLQFMRDKVNAEHDSAE